MGKYFGTDGIRGKANVNLDAERAFKVGRFLGDYFAKEGKKKIVIGKDTRLSSDMLESALAAGITAQGCDAYLIGYCPTPTVCYLTVHEDFAVGAMISASHNPYYDNGIKIFSRQGIKLPSDIEDLIEAYLDKKTSLFFKTDEEIGRIYAYPEGIEHYLQYICDEFPLDLSDMKIAIDCANGSAGFTAQKALERLGARVYPMHNTPDGLNINTHCGSTHPESMIAYMKENDFDLGLTFDGDADRQILVRPDGELVNGDYMLYICAKHYRDLGILSDNTIVTTVMANLGLWKAMEKEGIRVAKTDVGDKYVYDCMVKNGYLIGGEQSGHIIFANHATTGDGLLSALAILQIMKETKKGIIELCEGLTIYPQLLVNVKVNDKEAAMNDEEVARAIEEVDKELHGNGRVLVRKSGTEPLVRVMAEAQSDAECERQCEKVAAILRRKYGI